MSPEERREYVRQCVAQMPPLSVEQRMDLRRLLRIRPAASVSRPVARAA